MVCVGTYAKAMSELENSRFSGSLLMLPVKLTLFLLAITSIFLQRSRSLPPPANTKVSFLKLSASAAISEQKFCNLLCFPKLPTKIDCKLSKSFAALFWIVISISCTGG